MPQVGDKHFPYTPAGEAAAGRMAAKFGKPVKNSKKKGSGRLSAFMKKGKK